MTLGDSFQEGSFYAVGSESLDAKVVRSTRPENISCKLEKKGKPIVCSTYNLDIAFNIMRVVSWCALMLS